MPIRPQRMSGGPPSGPFYVAIGAGGIVSVAVDGDGRMHTWNNGRGVDYPVPESFLVVSRRVQS